MKLEATPEKFDEFKRAAEPLCNWFRSNLCQHDAVIVKAGQVKVISDLMSIPLEEEVEAIKQITCDCGRNEHSKDANYCGSCGCKLEKAAENGSF